MRYDHLRLDNGLELVGEHSDDALSLAAGYFCRTGARDETAAESGVSHFLEHMMFKGTATIDYDQINKTFDRIGAQYNAFTSEENTVYYGQVLPEFQKDLIGLLSQMMRPALRIEDFTMEKKVILEEIAMYDDRPLWVAHDHCRRMFYGSHPLSQSVLGTSQSITKLNRDQMAGYFARRYAPDNLTFCLAGNYDWDEAVALVEQHAAEWEPQGATRVTREPEAHAGLEVIPNDRFKQCNVYVLAPGYPAQDPRRYAAAVAAACVGSGQASRLHWALVDPGLAEDAALYHDEEDGAGAFAGVVVCEPERLQEVLDIYRGTLRKAQDEGLRPDEVRRTVRRLSSSIVLQAETPLSRLVNVGFDWVYRKDITPLDQLIERYEAVTPEACNEVLADRPLDRLSLVCVGPVSDVN